MSSQPIWVGCAIGFSGRATHAGSTIRQCTTKGNVDGPPPAAAGGKKRGQGRRRGTESRATRNLASYEPNLAAEIPGGRGSEGLRRNTGRCWTGTGAPDAPARATRYECKLMVWRGREQAGDYSVPRAGTSLSFLPLERFARGGGERGGVRIEVASSGCAEREAQTQGRRLDRHQTLLAQLGPALPRGSGARSAQPEFDLEPSLCPLLLTSFRGASTNSAAVGP